MILNKFFAQKNNIIHSVPNRIGGLDELRGIAVLWVMISHGAGLIKWMPAWVGGIGVHGVILFFMISGFLITKILLGITEKKSSLSTFYVRRIFRIWPLMLIVLLISIIWDSSKNDLVWANLLLINNFTMAKGWDVPFRTDVLWSLAIEEQFYLIWPLIVLTFNKENIFRICCLGIVLGFAVDSGLISAGFPIVQKTSQANMQYILIGCLAAVLELETKFNTNIKKLLLPLLLSIPSIVVTILKFDSIHGRTFINWYGNTILVVSAFIFVIYRPTFLNVKPLAYLGKLCYGLYLVHFFISYLVASKLGPTNFLAPFLYFSISIVLAHVSYEYFEMPINGIRTIFERNIRKFQMLCIFLIGIVFIALVNFINTLQPIVR